PVISPRLNFRYSITPKIIARASYSTGFRAPQTFDEDLHVSAVGGGGAIIFQDENLKTEKSQSISASGDFYHNFGNVQTNLLIEGFYTRLNNIFKLESQGVDASGNLILLRTNGRGAVVKGINFEYQIVPNNKIDFQAGFTIQRSQYLEPEAWSIDENVPACKTMFRSPNNYGFFTSNWQMLNKTLLSLSGTYTGSMVVQHFAGYIDADRVERTKDFFDLIVKVEQQVNINGQMILNLNAGVMNVFNSYQKDFDKGEFRDANFIYGPSLPRTYFVGLKLDL
ncbi:MAG: TonB-dependent receptor, partial [Bacteroidales bacterium]|nr:TonB-dependent receptor [Bacteroidales bacterium]